MNVLVNGVGNIGTTILQILHRYRSELGISKLLAHKRTIHAWNRPEIDALSKQGIIVIHDSSGHDFISSEEGFYQADYVFDTGRNGSGIQNKSFYESLPSLQGTCAQGSEKGFGISFMAGLDEQLILNQKFVHIVSCNTHGTAALLRTFCGDMLENLAEADCVVVRRSEDIGNHERLVSGNVVARHLNSEIGTHHAIDVIDMFTPLGISCKLTSSDITTASQFMHSVRFNIHFKNSVSKSEIKDRLAINPLIAITQKFDSNVIFEAGRRYGFNGRIFSHAIVLSENMLITEDSVKGWAFIPQEGNSILSSIQAFMIQMNLKNRESVFQQIQRDLLRKEW